MSNKENAINFFKMLFQNKVREAYDKFIAPDFIHHNPWFKGDRESLMLGMEEAHSANPESKLTVKHVLEDGDFVTTHSHVKHNENQEFAAIHIFKFKNGKVVELWDSAFQIEKNSPNENGPF